MALLSENFGLLHHILDIFVDGDDAVEYALRPVAGEGGLGLDDGLVLLDFLLHID